MKRKMLVFILMLSFLLIVGGCSQEETDGVSMATENRYRESEIREYEGARLDPAIGPRDNSIKGVQLVDTEDYTLKVTGLVDEPIDLAYEDVLELDTYRRKITLYCVEGWDATILWEGSLLEDIFNTAGMDPKADTVIFHGVDGYTTSLPLETIVNNQLILAYRSNGLELPPEMGYPFIVVAEDKLGYKWARWVTEIQLSDESDYEGYWERRGYSNEADL
ncbi:molybdopterin-dependent oxidoreductase [Gudongella sp. DL1XJH-153]|uniref:molybdopterin-dependent oxidoreductase n=1 Tax=Gudongella sp. DL1XJH-153 TaxID=3409804 RepID=UPI003BB8109A